MKKFLGIVLFVFISNQAVSQYQARVELNSGDRFTAEIVHKYEARWFWEKEAIQWFAVLESGAGLESLRLISEKTIQSISTVKNNTSFFQDAMIAEALDFKRLPMNGPLFVSTGHSGHHLHENMYGDFAWDFEVRWQGERAKGPQEINGNHYVWGKKVFSPISGTVHEVFRNSPDNGADPSLSSDLSGKGDGNFVLIHLKGSYFVSLLHFQQGSIPSHIVPGTKLEPGDYLGRVGNSGKSYLPHLHLTTYFWDSELNRMISVPNVFKKVSVFNASGGKEYFENYKPRTGDRLMSPVTTLRCY